MSTAKRPTLLSSCASAATAREARFRIAALQPPPRRTAIIALDQAARAAAGRLDGGEWGGVPVLTAGVFGRTAVQPPGLLLSGGDGSPVELAELLTRLDAAVLLATGAEGAPAASAVAEACARGTAMLLGLVVGDGDAAAAVVTALRPHVAVLLVSRDEDDVAGVLSALRA